MKFLVILFFLVPFAVAGSSGFSESFENENPLEVFDQTLEITSKHFYDQSFRGLPWAQLVKRARKQITPSTRDASLAKIINDLLKRLHASHTEFLTSQDQEYWALESVFSGSVDGAPAPQIGAWFVRQHGKWFVQNVFSGSSAQRSGLLPGDEVVSVDGKSFEPILSFGVDKTTHSIQIRRSLNGPILKMLVLSTRESFQRTMLLASKESFVVYNLCGKRIGYFHLWSGTNEESMKELADVAKKASDSTDAFILDLRDGFGGAYPAFLNPFFDHDESGQSIATVYAKPMTALINQNVRSGKEWITDLLKKSKRATLIGERTKGYFLAGKLFKIIPGKYDLYLAVKKGAGPDLEGKGVKPDIEVPQNLEYSAGYDPQLQTALAVLSKSNLQSGLCQE